MDKQTAAQIVALSVVMKAVIATHPDHDALRKVIREVMKDGFKDIDDESLSLIERSVLNWMNGLRRRVEK
jgi:hypothetical protein